MPLAGLILNRTHPNLTSVTDSSVQVALDRVTDELTRACSTFTPIAPRLPSANCTCCSGSPRPIRRSPIVGVPALPFEVADKAALQAVAEQIVSRG